jgi:glycosyltransferase involved in cell wall biosynthesis
MDITVTIGICVRNSENFIDKALSSILDQDFDHKKMEMIIVDDGSQDLTPSIIKKFAAKSDIKTKTFFMNWQGLGPIRNIVLNNALGEFILWVDSDEILPSYYVREQIEYINKNPTIGITAGIFKLTPRNLVLNLELMPSIFSRALSSENNFIWKTERLVGTGGSTFRTKALRQVNGFSNTLTQSGEDVDVARKILKAGWLIQLNNSPFYELHGGLSNFKQLWTKYSWYGYGARQIYLKNRKLFSFPRMSPFAGIFTGLLYSLIGYKLLRKNIVFLLPIHYGFKMTAWSYGFFKRQITVK